MGTISGFVDKRAPHIALWVVFLIRTWHPVTILPARQVAYAVQWFALALTLAVIVIVLQIRSRKKGK